MRSLFLFLSRQKRLRRFMETSPLARRLSSRFVAGETLEDALAVSRRVRSEGITVTLDHLGENVSSLEEAAVSRDIYLETMAAQCRAGLEGNVSLKLTQFGMDISESACRGNVEQLAREAEKLGAFVRVDMEAAEYTDATLRMVMDLYTQFGTVGAVLQAYLRRSEKDVEDMCRLGVRVRLCKGAYLEPASVAFQRKSEVDDNFVRLMKVLLAAGKYPGIATHDENMIEQAKSFVQARHISLDSFEFQMLYGIRRDLQKRLISEGYRLRLYVPFGKAWYPYFMRRLAERPANVLFLARNLLRG